MDVWLVFDGDGEIKAVVSDSRAATEFSALCHGYAKKMRVDNLDIVPGLMEDGRHEWETHLENMLVIDWSKWTFIRKNTSDGGGIWIQENATKRIKRVNAMPPFGAQPIAL